MGMTIGDIVNSLKRIEELEKQKAEVWENREGYLHPDEKIDQIDMLISLEKSRNVDGDSGEY